jgi:hydrogenase nickel incorporation protein HypA/HybF
MHELAIAESIIDALKEQVKGKITSIKLRIGEMSGVVPESLRFSFQIASEGTAAEGATLDIEHVPLTAMCNNCLETFRIQNYCFECSGCGRSNFKVISGRELMIEEVEVED